MLTLKTTRGTKYASKANRAAIPPRVRFIENINEQIAHLRGAKTLSNPTVKTLPSGVVTYSIRFGNQRVHLDPNDAESVEFYADSADEAAEALEAVKLEAEQGVYDDELARIAKAFSERFSKKQSTVAA